MIAEALLALATCRGGTAANQDMTALIGGDQLSEQQVRDLEGRLRASPADLDARARLLGYYFLRSHQSEQAKKARQAHILWLIRNRPESQIAGLPYASLDATIDGEAYHKGRALWLAQAKERSADTAVLGNAATFLQLYDRAAAKDLLLQAARLEPDCPEWLENLGRLQSFALLTSTDPEPRQRRAAEALQYYERALALMEPDQRIELLRDAAKAALEAGQLEKAEAWAGELLAQAPGTGHWNHGNAVHHGNLILGRLAVRRGDLESGRRYLLAAGRTPGSPQLDSFGPNMSLALELLNKGESAVVLEYFELCAQFWKTGAAQLKNWAATVRGGGIPDFGANLNY